MTIPSVDHPPTVILHADDFGMNAAVNAGILRCFRDGILTSTSILANAPFATEACAAWPRLVEDVRSRTLPSAEKRQQLGDLLTPFDIGVHLNLTQGRPLSGDGYPTELLTEKGLFPGIGRVFRSLRTAKPSLIAAVEIEFQRQVEWVRDHQIQPTHLNGHQYVELMPAISHLIPKLMTKYSIPVIRVAREPNLASTVLLQGRFLAYGLGMVKRWYAGRFQTALGSGVGNPPWPYFGTCHAGMIDGATLARFLRAARRSQCTEIGVHPADEPDQRVSGAVDNWDDPLEKLRPLETRLLCDHATVQIFERLGLRLGRLAISR